VNNKADKEGFFRTVNLAKFYPETQTHALSGVNLTIQRGEFVWIKGPSGSGKSTLLYLLAGLLRPTKGEIYFQDTPLDTIKNKALYRRNNIGFVFQDFYLYSGFTVLENVLFPGLHRFFIPQVTVKKAEILLEYLHMHGRRNLPVEVLSAGERQRACLARALLYEPQCIFADEPTGNLDSENAKNILALLQKINNEHGTTILLVTHDEEISRYAHRLIHIIDGQLED